MKFSVLLPTRNRLEYLRYAIESVRRQDHQDWEIIVSDNDSEDDIAGYVASLSDSRVRYFRTDRFVPVTDNWNNALERSTGDYVVMLGDDDGLLPSYFSKMLGAFRDFPDPDFVYVSAFFYAYPGVMPDSPNGHLSRDANGVFTETAPFWLDKERATGIARGYLSFRMPVASNMQFTLISRRRIAAMAEAGPFFQSPYPDFYATPALFLTSDRILIYPHPMVVVGITPKSYGFFHFNNRAAEGVKFLKNDDEQPFAGSSVAARMLPGTSYNDSWLLAMEALAVNHGLAHGMRPDYRRYRLLQIVHGYKKCYLDRAVGPAEIRGLRRRMTWAEGLTVGVPLQLGFSLLRLLPAGLQGALVTRLRSLIGQRTTGESGDDKPAFQNLMEVFDWMESRSATAAS